MKKRFIPLLLVISIIMGILAGCSSPAKEPAVSKPSDTEGTQQGTESATPDEIVIGALYPLTGPNAKTGKEFVDSIELAIDIINNKYDDLGDFPFAKTEGIPSMNGAKLKLVTADTQGNPEVGATETERLITTENLDLVLGCYQSAVTKTASVAAERLEVPFVNSSSTSAALTERGFKWFFRTGPTDTTFVIDTIKFMDRYKDSVGIENVAIVAEDTEFGMQFATMFEEAAIEAGYNIVEDISYPANAPSVSSEVIRIKSANPDVVVQLSYVSDAIMFMKAYKDMDVNPKMIIGQRAGFTTPEYVSTLGKDADYMISTSVFSIDLADNKPYLKTINEKFKSITGVDLTTEYARAMQTVFIVADALNRAGTSDKEAVRLALAETDLGAEWMLTPYDGVKFDENQQNVLANGIIIQLVDGVYKTIYPDKYAIIEPVIPVPAWKDR